MECTSSDHAHEVLAHWMEYNFANFNHGWLLLQNLIHDDSMMEPSFVTLRRHPAFWNRSFESQQSCSRLRFQHWRLHFHVLGQWGETTSQLPDLSKNWKSGDLDGYLGCHPEISEDISITHIDIYLLDIWETQHRICDWKRICTWKCMSPKPPRAHRKSLSLGRVSISGTPKSSTFSMFGFSTSRSFRASGSPSSGINLQ